MPALCSLSDSELVARLPTLVRAERHAMADLIEHLVEMERRRLYVFGEPHIETKIRAKNR